MGESESGADEVVAREFEEAALNVVEVEIVWEGGLRCGVVDAEFGIVEEDGFDACVATSNAGLEVFVFELRIG